MCVGVVFSFFGERYFLFQTEVSVVKPVKFLRDSGCQARDEFLVNFKENHILIYMYIIFTIVVIVGHCITLHYVVCVGYFQS